MKEDGSKTVPCTLCSGDYHLGVGALANSLYRNGFRGTMFVGYQTPFPPWAIGCAESGEPITWEVADSFQIRFVPWPARRNLSLEKAGFLLHVLDQEAPYADAVAFFDADSVIKANWQFFESWVACGVGLCLDVSYPLVPCGHPWRHGWRALAAELGHSCRDLEYYFSSAFVGVSRRWRELAVRWAESIDHYLSGHHAPPINVKFGERTSPFCGDQDFLNVAAMATAVPLSVIGQEAMDFIPAGFIMSQVVDTVKPWRRKFILDALAGRPPGAAEKAYWANVEGPVRLFSRKRIGLSRAALRLAGIIGRFYRRG